MPFQKGHKDFRTKEGIEKSKEHLRNLAKKKKGIASDTSHLKEHQFKEGQTPWNKGKKYKFKDFNYSDERYRQKHRQWIKEVKKRDKFICQTCGKSGDNNQLVAHHIKSWKNNINLRFDIDNGKTMCRGCHCLLHNPIKHRWN